ncbi:aspartic peptidase domain-containing protein [Ampelomyces quisqualis]|uniref:Aspartic peptidase domain-containing protein n=1 Tax=Ampelomyces quisqualis TaxID=50730 RepID=A0A6A5QZA9_AMPQU|nr:aspartic peptidase domain-containing protein [Ampelomyces quisqualis]
MRIPHVTIFGISLIALSIVTATTGHGRIAARNDITDNVLELTIQDEPRRTSSPASQHLARRCANSLCNRGIQQDLVSYTRGRSYTASISIGGQRFALIIDTGSTGTWVATTGFICYNSTRHVVPSSECRFGPLFNSAASTSFKYINQETEIGYAGGNFVRGHKAKDKLRIEGVMPQHSSNVIEQTITTVTEAYFHGDRVSSGLLGLAYPVVQALNREEEISDSFLYTLFQDRNIPPILSLALNRSTSSTPRAGGLLAFGGIPDIATNDDWVQTPIIPHASGIGVYNIEVDGFSIRPSSLNPMTLFTWEREDYGSSRQTMIIDSGATSTHLPPEVVEYVAKLFSPRAHYDHILKHYVVACNAEVPHFGIKIAGTTYRIPEEDLIIERREQRRRGQCSLKIVPSKDGVLVLGASWLKNVVVVFDMHNAAWTEGGSSNRDSSYLGYVSIASRKEY